VFLEYSNQAMVKAHLEYYIMDSLNTKVNRNYTGGVVHLCSVNRAVPELVWAAS
jgi:hypothetical protein